MNYLKLGFLNKKVKFSNEVENALYAKKQKLNPPDGIPIDFLHPTDNMTLMMEIRIKCQMIKKILQSLRSVDMI